MSLDSRHGELRIRIGTLDGGKADRVDSVRVVRLLLALLRRCIASQPEQSAWN